MNAILSTLATLAVVGLTGGALTWAVAGAGTRLGLSRRPRRAPFRLLLARPFLLALVLAAAAALTIPTAHALTWTKGIIDSSGDVGKDVSIAYSPTTKQPSVAYYDATNKQLRFSTFNGSTWSTPVIVDDGGVAGYDVGRYPSLAFTSAGSPRIAYQDATNESLKYATFNGTFWSTSVVKSHAGLFNVLVFDSSGSPAIVTTDTTPIYQTDSAANEIFYCSLSGSTWTVSSVAYNNNTKSAYQYLSLAFNPSTGFPSIAYKDTAGNDLFYIERKLQGVYFVWESTTIDPAAGLFNDIGDFASLAFDPSTNTPVIAYRDSSLSKLKYATRNTSGIWIVTILDDGGKNAALKFDPVTKKPVIAFRQAGRLMLSTYDGTVWFTETADDTLSSGAVALAVHPTNANNRAIAHYDSTSKVLRFAIAAPSSGTGVRDLPSSGIYTPQSSFVSHLSLTPGSGVTSYKVTEFLPAGIKKANISSISHGGAATDNALIGSYITWTLSDGVARNLSYVVTPPANTSGILTFSGSFTVNGGSTSTPITGDTEMESASMTVNRDLDGVAYAPGVAELVKLNVTPSAPPPTGINSYTIREYYPLGWTVAAADIGNGGQLKYDFLKQRYYVGWDVSGVNLGTQSLTYKAKPPVTASGVVSFSGIYFVNGSSNSHEIEGETELEYTPLPLPGTASRSMPASATVGTQFTVQVQLAVGSSGVTTKSLEETLPSGVSFVSADNGGQSSGGKITWSGLPGGQQTVSYVLQATTAGGGQGFTGTYTANGSMNVTVGGTTGLTITAPAVVPGTASRSMPGSATVGTQFTVQVQLAVGSSGVTTKSLEETLPSGVSFVSADNGGQSSGGKITWSGLPGGQQTVSYVLQATTAGGGQGFTGTYTANGSMNVAVGGTTGLTITAPPTTDPTPPPPPENSAIRVLPATYEASTALGVQIVVTPDQMAGSAGYSVTETIPTGWTLDANSLSDDDHAAVNGGTITWSFTDALARTLSYTVTPGDVDGIKTFAGHLNVAGGADIPTIGDLSIKPRLAAGLSYLYVVSTGRVDVYDAISGDVIKIGLITSLVSPRGLVVWGDKLYVADANTQTIGTYNPFTGAAVNPNFISNVNAKDIVIHNGRLYAAMGAQVGIYDANTGASLGAITGHNTVYGLAIANTRLYVADSGTGSVATYDLANANAATPNFITDQTAPLLPDIDIAEDGTLYLSTFSVGKVGAYDASTGALLSYGFVSGLSAPSGVEVSNGILYVVDMQTGSVHAYEAHLGTPLMQNFITDLASPRYVVAATNPDLDDDGTLNGSDTDIDGDGIPNGTDPDIDGDGIPNDQDTDIDGDNIPNDQDPDIDGDGIPNDQDTTPGGPGSGGNSGQYHPADTSHDFSIDIDELSLYAEAWVAGTPWGSTGQSVDIDYLSRAEDIWLRGETYTVDNAQSAPLKWVPLP